MARKNVLLGRNLHTNHFVSGIWRCWLGQRHSIYRQYIYSRSSGIFFIYSCWHKVMITVDILIWAVYFKLQNNYFINIFYAPAKVSTFQINFYFLHWPHVRGCDWSGHGLAGWKYLNARGGWTYLSEQKKHELTDLSGFQAVITLSLSFSHHFQSLSLNYRKKGKNL